MNITNMSNSSESAAARDLRTVMQGSVLLRGDDESAAVNGPQQILQSALAALSEGRVSEIVEQFADRFTFNDHALRLEFADKTHLTDFFEKLRALFPDIILEIGSLFESGDHAIAEWRLSATESVPFGSISSRVPISLQGSTIIGVENGRIVRWSEYYDQSSSLPINLAAFFTEWIKY